MYYTRKMLNIKEIPCPVVLVIFCAIAKTAIGSGGCQTSKLINFHPCPTWPEQNMYTEDDGPIYLLCSVISNTGTVALTWYKNGTELKSDQHIYISDDKQRLKIELPVQEDSGYYSCKAAMANSSITYEGYILVTEAFPVTHPRIVHTVPLDQEQKVFLGSSTNISCTFDVGTEMSTPEKMQWSKNGDLLYDNNTNLEYQIFNLESQTVLMLQIQNISVDDLGVYQCYGKNGYGSDSRNITLLRDVNPGGSGEVKVWLLIAISGGAAFIVLMFIVSIVIAVCRRKHNEKIDWEDPDLEHYEVPQHKLEYDVFISYSSEDEKWVKETLFTNLVQNGYHVNIDFKDFVPGMAIAENVMDSIYKSRKTVVVMSKNFLKSMWGQFELQQAHNRAISQRKDVLILIKYGKYKVPAKLIGKTFLDFTDKTIAQHFWQRFYDAIGKPGDDIQRWRKVKMKVK
ncbi:interleukin-1 receptor accessory protein-like 1-B isoform X2 [Mytilus californianus]|uniref:interleukin-1 receptor accessory protein-like 1-B isoform X2 n=1 Tax=Mytilus californianus TaxID=6549 RepID=UPI0022483BF2|nr:interleukin-1 receptor accessory protein-like 1-B isoform X2 [Mytilus californianus]